MSYWLLAIPDEGDAKSAVSKLDARVRSCCSVHKLGVPVLRVGFMDLLITLSDRLRKLDGVVGATVKKLERTIEELAKHNEESSEGESKSSSFDIGDIPIDDKSPEKFVETFAWDAQRFDPSLKLPHIVDVIEEDTTRCNQELKRRVGMFTELRTAYLSCERRQTGTLMVRSLNGVVKAEDIIDGGRHVRSVFVVVPKKKQKEFEQSYETLEDVLVKREKEERKRQEERDELNRSIQEEVEAQLGDHSQAQEEDGKGEGNDEGSEKTAQSTSTSNQSTSSERKEKLKLQLDRSVVPGSAKVVCDEKDYVLYRVVVLKDWIERFSKACREARFAVRDFEFNEQAQHREREQLENTRQQMELALKQNFQFCLGNLSFIMNHWLHVKALRLFVEGVLTYGPPPEFSCVALKVRRGYEKKLRGLLAQAFAHLDHSKEDKDQQGGSDEFMSSHFGSEEYYPYVWVPLELK